jgi:hypothetical protein
MQELGQLEKVDVREIWPNEATDFTPWLAENISFLGNALGMELEVEALEASVGDFSLDLQARDLGRNLPVIIENQLTDTDHDHLGKLLTYAAGFDAGVVIWIAKSIREEHRQTLDWLNQRTSENTEFFGVVVQVLKIGESKPAVDFRMVAFPNEWRRGGTVPPTSISPKMEAYRNFFQKLIDILREEHRFTNARVGQPQSWYSFSSGVRGLTYASSFALGGRIRTELYIDLGDRDDNKKLFDRLHEHKQSIQEKLGEHLEWERLDDKRASRIALYRDGSIEDDDATLEELRNWAVDRLLKFKEIFGPIATQEVASLTDDTV